MRNRASQIVAALVLGALVGTAAMAQSGDEITQLKNLHLQTTLVRGHEASAAIVAPSDGRYHEAVAIIQQAIRQAGGVELPVIADDAGAPEVLLKDRSLIAVGNMATSKFMYQLYRQYYTWLDLRYPGRNGYVVRSLHNPFATGYNILLLGGSDDAGVLRAARHFAETLEAGDPLVVGWRMDIQLGEDIPTPPEPDAAEIYGWSDSTRMDEGGNRIGRGPLRFSGWNPFSTQAALYYMTGDEKYLREFLRLAFPDRDNLPEPVRTLYVERSESGEYDMTRPIAMAHHYTAHRMPLLWDLIEESPLLTDEQRLRITNDIRWNCELVTNYGIGHSRHGAYAGLTAYTAGRYFNKHYPGERWTKLLERVHNNFMWWTRHPTWGESDQLPWINTCIHPVAIYFMLSDPQPWIDSGMARTMLDTLPAIWSGRPYEPAIEAQALNLMHMAAWMLGDGRYTYMARAANYDYSLFRIDQSWWPTPELDAVPPTDLVGRVSLVPLPEPDARDAGVPFDAAEGFQYVTYRTGLGPDDSFLLLDGFNGGRRNPHHVASLNYLRAGPHELLAGYGNQVHILREGLSENNVAMAAKFGGAFSGEGMAYLSAVVPDDAFSSRRRGILSVDDRLTLVIDSLTAREAGNFEITCQWEPVRALHSSDQDFRWAQSDGDHPVTLVAAQPVRLSNAPGPLQHSSSLASIIDGLLTDDYVLNQQLDATLAAGERLTIVNAIYADEAPGRFAHRLDQLLPSLTLVSGRIQAALASGPCDSDSLMVDADLGYLSSQRLFAYRGREMRAGGVLLWGADKPVSLVWNLDEASLTIEASEPVSVRLALTADAVPAVNGRAVAAGESIRLAAGTHRITAAVPAFVERLADVLAGLGGGRVEAMPRTIERPQPNWTPTWTARLPSAARLMRLTPRGDKLWIAGDSPEPALHCLGLDGKLRWSFELPAPANALAMLADTRVAGGLLMVAGGQDNQLRTFNANGELLWSVESQVWPGHQPAPGKWDASWYTQPQRTTGIRGLQIGDLAGTGSPQILLGRPATFEAWSLEGTLMARSPVRWGELSRLELLSYGGEKRLLIGNFYTGRDHVLVVAPDMKVQRSDRDRWNYMLPVPPGATEMGASLQRGIAGLQVVDLDGDGNDEVVVARGGHWNDLRVYNADGSQCLWMYSFGPAAPRIVQEHKGLFVRDMSVGTLLGENEKTVAIGLFNGWTHCFAADGRLLWSRQMGDIVTAVTHVGGKVAVGLKDGSLSLLDKGGVVRSAKLNSEVRALVGADELLLAGTDEGTIAAFAP